MADKIPQFDNAQPVLNTQPVTSKAAGFESYAQAFGQIAQDAGDTAVKVQADQSKAQYVQSATNIEQLKSDSDIRMLKDPNNASRIAQDMKNTSDDIVKNSYVSQADRQNLTHYAAGNVDEIKYKAAETSVRQSQLSAAFSHYQSWPLQLKAYQDALISDPTGKTAEDLQAGMVSSLKSLVMSRALTPEQAASAFQTMKAIPAVASDHVTVFGKGDATAQDYQTLAANPLSNSVSNAGSPINGHTAWLTDFHTNDMSMQNALADVSQGVLPNPQAFDNFTPAERQHIIFAMHGVQDAKGMINSAQPIPVIQNAYDQLAFRGESLSYQDEAKKNALGLYLDQIKKGDYLATIGSDPVGGQMMQNFTAQNAALQQSNLSPDQKMQQAISVKNNLSTQALSYGQARGFPTSSIQPIVKQDVAVAQNAFNQGQDPGALLSVVGQYNKNLTPWVINSLQKPTQKMAAAAVAYADSTVPPQEKLDFIAAQQQGRMPEYSQIKLQRDVNASITSRIANNLTNQAALLNQQYPSNTAVALNSAMIQNTRNYANYLALKNGDLTMNHWKSYVDQASKLYSSSIKPQTGTNYVVNSQQLPNPLTNAQLSTLAAFAIHKGQEYITSGRQDYITQSALDRNPLKMVISPTNDVMAVDGNNQVYYSVPFSTSLMSHAQKVLDDVETQRRQTLQAAEEADFKRRKGIG